MNIAKACIKHKVATLLAVIMVVIFGVLFGTRLQMALMPNMEMPMAVVMTTYVGANPSWSPRPWSRPSCPSPAWTRSPPPPPKT